ncbi:arginine/lysine/ornithine decarboxylase [Rhizobium wenxiniae]|uniref:Arginine/lysine/ornithine decarboxylase n=1 Tax=Rhizobium wenxiniae TaxID=1737357 RepID=A0A7W9YEL2_9HYPH|nr:arginine/lysine/ornithine decarboxylase [Rhizobium wenxiniae]
MSFDCGQNATASKSSKGCITFMTGHGSVIVFPRPLHNNEHAQLLEALAAFIPRVQNWIGL